MKKHTNLIQCGHVKIFEVNTLRGKAEKSALGPYFEKTSTIDETIKIFESYVIRAASELVKQYAENDHIAFQSYSALSDLVIAYWLHTQPSIRTARVESTLIYKETNTLLAEKLATHNNLTHVSIGYRWPWWEADNQGAGKPHFPALLSTVLKNQNLMQLDLTGLYADEMQSSIKNYEYELNLDLPEVSEQFTGMTLKGTGIKVAYCLSSGLLTPIILGGALSNNKLINNAQVLCNGITAQQPDSDVKKFKLAQSQLEVLLSDRYSQVQNSGVAIQDNVRYANAIVADINTAGPLYNKIETHLSSVAQPAESATVVVSFDLKPILKNMLLEVSACKGKEELLAKAELFFY